MTSFKVQPTSFKVQLTSFKVQLTSFKVQLTSFKVQRRQHRRWRAWLLPPKLWCSPEAMPGRGNTTLQPKNLA